MCFFFGRWNCPRPPRTTRRPKTRLSVFLPRQTEALSSRVVLRPEPEMSVFSSCAARRGVDWLFVGLRQRVGCCCPTRCFSPPPRATFFFFQMTSIKHTRPGLAGLPPPIRYRLIMLGPPQSAAASTSPGSWVLARGLSLISLPCLPCDRPERSFFRLFHRVFFPGRAFHDVRIAVRYIVYILPRLTLPLGFCRWLMSAFGALLWLAALFVLRQREKWWSMVE